MMDYQQLLTKYMSLIYHAEGTLYLGFIDPEHAFSLEEELELVAIGRAITLQDEAHP